MISLRRTGVAVLRQVIGLSVEEFGKLIGKSHSTITKLDAGDLPLSLKTAQVISRETGVSMRWLMADDPKAEPYFSDVENGEQAYTKEVFERVQAAKQKPNSPLDPAMYLVVADIASIPWHLVYANAERSGNGQHALYLYRQFLDGLVERFGTDPEEFLKVNQTARRTAADGSEWAFASAKALELKTLGEVVLTRVGGPVPVRKRNTPKTVPVRDVPVDVNGYPDWDALPAEPAAPEPVRKKPARRPLK